MIVSKHAQKRMKSRMNIKSKNAKKVARKALEKGITHSEATGDLRKIFDGFYLKYKLPIKVRIYFNHAFLFDARKDTLITVIPVYKELRPLIRSIFRKRGKKNEV